MTEKFPENLDALAPGAYIAFVATSPNADVASVKFRSAGCELRDTILVLSSTEKFFIFLYRRPTESLEEQAIRTGTGLLNIDAVRLKSGIALCERPGCPHPKSLHEMEAEVGHRKCKAHNLRFAGDCDCPDFVEEQRARFNNERHRGSAYIVQQKSSYVDPGGSGRWPSNVLLIHDPNCSERDCVPSCVVFKLDAIIGKVWYREIRENSKIGGFEKGAGRFFARFHRKDELFAWIQQLITPANVA